MASIEDMRWLLKTGGARMLDPYPWYSPSEGGVSANPDFDSVWSPGEDYEQDQNKYPPFAERPTW